MMLTHLDLFSGLGGFALACRWNGIETVQFVEINKFCQTILNKHFPGVPIHGDIRTYHYTGSNPTILTGGFPCQPFSVAGKRRGAADDRALWPEMFRVICEARPAWVLAENVTGIIGMELDNVLTDLESEGYETQPLVIPACAVGAPHRRDRVWVVAYSASNRCGSRRAESTGFIGRDDAVGADCDAADAPCGQGDGRRAGGMDEAARQGRYCDTTAGHGDINAADAARQLLDGSVSARDGRNQFTDDCLNAPHAGRPGLQGQCPDESKGYSGQPDRDWRNEAKRRWAENWTSAATRFCGVDARLPHRVDRLKALGNSIVPQVAAEIIHGIVKVSQ